MPGVEAAPSLDQLESDPSGVVLSTAPFDPRFPNTNQTKHCWQNYIDYHMCVAAKGEDYKPCGHFFRNYKIMCPQSWVQRWDEQREEGNYPSDISPATVVAFNKRAQH